MSDLISRQAAIDAMTNTLWHYPNECYRNLNEYEFAKGLAELGLKSVPPVQSKIIYCKDCKYLQKWRSEESAKKFGQIYECGKDVLREPVPDDYCSKAERRTDD